MDQNPPASTSGVPHAADSAALLEDALFQVKRVIVGQDRMVERAWSACWPAATASSRACPAWPRR